MEIIKDAGLPLKAEVRRRARLRHLSRLCGAGHGSENCTRVRPRKMKMLDEAFMVKPVSRLSCQILMSPELNGLQISLAPEG